MCRILFKEDNSKKFNQQILEESYTFNSDGTGVVYYDPKFNSLKVKKFVKGTPFTNIYRYLKWVENNPNFKNIAIHFRFATSGGLEKDKIHPVYIKKNSVLLHNGVCQSFEFDKQSMSDTQLMAFWLKCRKFDVNNLPKVGKGFYEKTFAGNKVLIIQQNNYIILNSHLGEWKDGIWRSWKDYSSSFKYKNYYGFDPFSGEVENCVDLEKQLRLFK